MRIVVADDEKELLNQIANVVRQAGHDIETFRNGLDLINGLKRETFDVILLDWNMPGKTGLEVLEWASENLNPLPPSILITSRQDKSDIVKGLEAGAIDYIVKPESDEVIRARVEAAGRRNTAPSPETIVRYGKYELNRKDETVTLEGKTIVLTAKEFALIDHLFQFRDRPLSRGYLFTKIWGGHVDLETRTIDVHVSRLRAKLDLKAENGFVIRTVFGFGYRMDEYIDEGT